MLHGGDIELTIIKISKINHFNLSHFIDKIQILSQEPQLEVKSFAFMHCLEFYGCTKYLKVHVFTNFVESNSMENLQLISLQEVYL